MSSSGEHQLELKEFTLQMAKQYESLENKLINQVFQSYHLILETYYKRINQMYLEIDGQANTAALQLEKMTEVVLTLQKISKSNEKIYHLAYNEAKKNHIIVSCIADMYGYKVSNGNVLAVKSNYETIDAQLKTVQASITSLRKDKPVAPNPPTTEENSLYYFGKDHIYLFNQFINKEKKEIKNSIFNKLSLTCKNNHIQIQLASKEDGSARYYGLARGGYVALFPTEYVLNPKNASVYDGIFDIEYKRTEQAYTAVSVTAAAIFKFNPSESAYHMECKGIAIIS